MVLPLMLGVNLYLFPPGRPLMSAPRCCSSLFRVRRARAMSSMQFLWAALALATVGFALIWYGASFQEVVLWVGLVVSSLGMLLGPLSRFIASG